MMLSLDLVTNCIHNAALGCNQTVELQHHRAGESAVMRLALNFKAAGVSGRDVCFDGEMR